MSKKISYQNFNLLFFLVPAIFLISEIILQFCSLFYDFGIIAKNMIASNSLFYSVLMMALLFFASLICRKFAVNASGSNLDNITKALLILKKHPSDYHKISQLLSLRIISISIISSLLASLGGGSLGREGIAIFIAINLMIALVWHLKKFLPTKINLESALYLGYYLGLSLAFNAPIAGLVYIAEKLVKNKSCNYVSIIILTFIAFILVSLRLVNHQAVYQIPKINFEISISAVMVYCCIAICGALIIFVFRKSLIIFYTKIANIKSNFLWTIIVISLIFVLSLLPHIASSSIAGGGILAVNEATANSQNLYTAQDFFGRLLTTILTFIIGCAGGTVAPTIAIGASFGSLFEIFANQNFMPLMMVGMVCFLSCLLATPLTSAIVIFESANQNLNSLLVLLPVALLAFFSYKFITILEKKVMNKIQQ